MSIWKHASINDSSNLCDDTLRVYVYSITIEKNVFNDSNVKVMITKMSITSLTKIK